MKTIQKEQKEKKENKKENAMSIAFNEYWTPYQTFPFLECCLHYSAYFFIIKLMVMLPTCAKMYLDNVMLQYWAQMPIFQFPVVLLFFLLTG
jgi:hypothetical protein